MAFPVAATLFDDFSRADGNVVVGDAGQWAEAGINNPTNKLATAGEQLKAEGASGNGRSATVLGPDVEMYATLSALPVVGSYVFFASRITPGATWTGYGAIIIRTEGNTFLCQIRKYTNGSNQTPGGWATATTTFEVGDKFGWSVINNKAGNPVIAIYRFHAGEWTLLAEQAETTFQYLNSGPIGIELGDNTARLDNLFAGTVGGAVLHSIELTDSLALADSLSTGTGKALEDVIVLSEAIAKQPGHTQADSLSLSDAIGKSAGHVEADALALSDELAKGVGHVEVDSLALSDSIGQRVTKNLNDALGLADSIARRVVKGIADLLGLSDSVTTGEPDQPAHLAIFDRPSTVLSIDDRPTTELALLDRPTTILTLEDQPA